MTKSQKARHPGLAGSNHTPRNRWTWEIRIRVHYQNRCCWPVYYNWFCQARTKKNEGICLRNDLFKKKSREDTDEVGGVPERLTLSTFLWGFFSGKPSWSRLAFVKGKLEAGRGAGARRFTADWPWRTERSGLRDLMLVVVGVATAVMARLVRRVARTVVNGKRMVVLGNVDYIKECGFCRCEDERRKKWKQGLYFERKSDITDLGVVSCRTDTDVDMCSILSALNYI